ncbi:hypothetical protein HDC93_007543 [Streptomyces sp. AK010]|nr:hypothetical protein [Streptomyces sp. AK010]
MAPAALEVSLQAVEEAEQRRQAVEEIWQASGAGGLRRRAGPTPVPSRRAGEPPGGAGTGARLGGRTAPAAATGRGVRPLPRRPASSSHTRGAQASPRSPATCPPSGGRRPPPTPTANSCCGT